MTALMIRTFGNTSLGGDASLLASRRRDGLD